jgi:hypothetical protein
MEDQSAYETFQSLSSRGSRITANLASFFEHQTAADNDLEDRQMAERARQQSLQQKQQLARAASSSAAAAAAAGERRGSFTPTHTEPASGLIKPSTDQLPRVDSDGFEIDDDEDDVALNNAAVARQVVTATGTPAAGGDGDMTPTPHHRTASGGGGQVTSMRPTSVQSASNLATSSAAYPSRSALQGTPEVSGPEGEASWPSVKGATTTPPEVAPEASAASTGPRRGGSAAAAAAAATLAQQQRRTTGKTGFIRDWLGSAEPAPEEGPSIALFNNGEIDDGDTAPVPGPQAAKRYTSRLEPVVDGPEMEEEMSAVEQDGVDREGVVANLAKSSHTDLRTVLEKDRINAESDSYAQEVEERESQSAAAAAAAGPTPSADTDVSWQGRKSAANRAMNTLFGMQHANKAGAAAGGVGTPGGDGGSGRVANGVQGGPSGALPQSDMHALQSAPSEDSTAIKVRIIAAWYFKHFGAL